MRRFRDLKCRVLTLESQRRVEFDQTHRRMEQMREDMGALRHRIELLEKKGGNRES